MRERRATALRPLTLRPAQEAIEPGGKPNETSHTLTHTGLTLSGHLATPIPEGVNGEKMTTVPIPNQPTIAQRSPTSKTMNSTITDLCLQCGKTNHTDKILADQCRLMTAMLGQGRGKGGEGQQQQ